MLPEAPTSMPTEGRQLLGHGGLVDPARGHARERHCGIVCMYVHERHSKERGRLQHGAAATCLVGAVRVLASGSQGRSAERLCGCSDVMHHG
jgi:hypothetical protein